MKQYNNILDAVIVLKKKNEVFNLLVKQLPNLKFKNQSLNFESLIFIIIKQQLSNIVAKSMFEKLKNTFSNNITPNKILKVNKNNLRECGISYSKINYIKNVSQVFKSNPKIIQLWQKLNDKECSIEIQKIKGLGPWSASIILLFYFQRLDIFPYEDSTLKKAYFSLYKKKLSKNLSEVSWARPYRSVLALYLWKWVDNGMVPLTN